MIFFLLNSLCFPGNRSPGIKGEKDKFRIITDITWALWHSIAAQNAENPTIFIMSPYRVMNMHRVRAIHHEYAVAFSALPTTARSPLPPCRHLAAPSRLITAPQYQTVTAARFYLARRWKTRLIISGTSKTRIGEPDRCARARWREWRFIHTCRLHVSTRASTWPEGERKGRGEKGRSECTCSDARDWLRVEKSDAFASDVWITIRASDPFPLRKGQRQHACDVNAHASRVSSNVFEVCPSPQLIAKPSSYSANIR